MERNGGEFSLNEKNMRMLKKKKRKRKKALIYKM
jgi:hypothetical protein